jgi:hypothetical protein
LRSVFLYTSLLQRKPQGYLKVTLKKGQTVLISQQYAVLWTIDDDYSIDDWTGPRQRSRHVTDILQQYASHCGYVMEQTAEPTSGPNDHKYVCHETIRPSREYRTTDRRCISMGPNLNASGISFDGYLFRDPSCVYLYTGEHCFCETKTIEFTPGGQSSSCM